MRVWSARVQPNTEGVGEFGMPLDEAEVAGLLRDEQVDDRIVSECFDEEFGIAELIEGFGRRTGIRAFDESARRVESDMSPRVGVQHSDRERALVLPPFGAEAKQPVRVEVAVMIIEKDVQDHILGAAVRLLDVFEPEGSLVYAEAADTEVADRLADVSRQIFLPGLAVADLMALGETVPEAVDPALVTSMTCDQPFPEWAVAIGTGGPVVTIGHVGVVGQIAKIRIELRPLGLRRIQKPVDIATLERRGRQEFSNVPLEISYVRLQCSFG